MKRLDWISKLDWVWNPKIKSFSKQSQISAIRLCQECPSVDIATELRTHKICFFLVSVWWLKLSQSERKRKYLKANIIFSHMLRRVGNLFRLWDSEREQDSSDNRKAKSGTVKLLCCVLWNFQLLYLNFWWIWVKGMNYIFKQKHRETVVLEMLMFYSYCFL